MAHIGEKLALCTTRLLSRHLGLLQLQQLSLAASQVDNDGEKTEVLIIAIDQRTGFQQHGEFTAITAGKTPLALILKTFTQQGAGIQLAALNLGGDIHRIPEVAPDKEVGDALLIHHLLSLVPEHLLRRRVEQTNTPTGAADHNAVASALENRLLHGHRRPQLAGALRHLLFQLQIELAQLGLCFAHLPNIANNTRGTNDLAVFTSHRRDVHRHLYQTAITMLAQGLERRHRLPGFQRSLQFFILALAVGGHN